MKTKIVLAFLLMFSLIFVELSNFIIVTKAVNHPNNKQCEVKGKGSYIVFKSDGSPGGVAFFDVFLTAQSKQTQPRFVWRLDVRNDRNIDLLVELELTEGFSVNFIRTVAGWNGDGAFDFDWDGDGNYDIIGDWDGDRVTDFTWTKPVSLSYIECILKIIWLSPSGIIHMGSSPGTILIIDSGGVATLAFDIHRLRIEGADANDGAGSAIILRDHDLNPTTFGLDIIDENMELDSVHLVCVTQSISFSTTQIPVPPRDDFMIQGNIGIQTPGMGLTDDDGDPDFGDPDIYDPANPDDDEEDIID